MDFDGAFTFSPIKVVEFKTDEAGSTKPFAFSVYPNPSRGVFNFNITDLNDRLEATNVKVFDVKGQVVADRNFENGEPMQIDVSNYPPGVYMAAMTVGENRTASQQLVLQR